MPYRDSAFPLGGKVGPELLQVGSFAMVELGLQPLQLIRLLSRRHESQKTEMRRLEPGPATPTHIAFCLLPQQLITLPSQLLVQDGLVA